jgi:hypothetical protein
VNEDARHISASFSALASEKHLALDSVPR